METESVTVNGVVESDDAITLEIEVTPAVEHRIVMLKESGRKVDPEKSDLQIATMIDAALTKDRIKRGWFLAAVVSQEDGPRRGKTEYTVVGKAPQPIKNYVTLIARCETKRVRSTMGIEFDNLLVSLEKSGKSAANRWAILTVDDSPYVPKDEQEVTYDESELVGYAPFALPENPEAWFSTDRKALGKNGVGNFDHLYGLDSAVLLVKSVLELAERTNFRKRVNIALLGRPGCGKSDICQTLKKMLGAESVFELDGTSTTMAGAQKELGEREELPRVMVIEEIEKAPESSLPWLLSIMDMRGEIRKTTARGNILRDARMIVICTVNDEETFKRINFGALYSRFTRKIHFRRPSRDLLWKILDREIKDVGGKEEWISPALDYAAKIDTTDPREVIAIALAGGDELLLPYDPKCSHRDGCRICHERSYQRMLDETMDESALREFTRE